MVVSFNGVPNYSYIVQRATSLSGPFSDIATNAAANNGIFQYVDTSPPQPSAYYRVRLP
jgi:hypothetical protein